MPAVAMLIAATGLLLPTSPSPQDGSSIQPTLISRRLAVSGLLSAFVTWVSSASAFDNGIPEMAEYRKKARDRGWSTYPGTEPALGLQGNGKLASCGFEPHCFSTSGDADRLLKLWRPPAGSNAMGELLEVVKSYPPFQARIDGGGFKIITADTNYLYVQFESLRKGFIDDVEFAVNRNGSVQVRSSSRLGFLDLGVNAKRLNWISANLRDKGWTAPAIIEEDYPDYFQKINFTYDDVRVPASVPRTLGHAMAHLAECPLTQRCDSKPVSVSPQYIRSVLSPQTCTSPTDVLNCQDPITAK